MENDIPVLYVCVRTELPSMTPGKAQAHSAHAANAFVYENLIRVGEPDQLSTIWMAQTDQGFGTQINLKAAWEDVIAAFRLAVDRNITAGIITDPTYPYEVDSEILPLINQSIHTADPAYRGDDRWVCFRSEQTAAYFFGLRSQLEPILGRWPLHP